jgi:hypothetical protein
MKKVMFAVAIGCLLFATSNTNAQSNKQSRYDPKWSIVAGLNQPILLKGYNIEVNYFTKKMVFDYSHGFNLIANGSFVDKEYEDQKVNFKITNSVGIGIGYRFTENFNLRFEPKIHTYQTYYDDVDMEESNSIKNFTTTTLGLGAYYRWLPFAKNENALKGITIVPSVRYWYRVASTLDDDGFKYQNTLTNKEETLKSPNIGVANTPIIVNVSIGYSF